MRLRCFAVVCAVIACAALYALLSYPSTSSSAASSALGEQPVNEAVSSIDFDMLHAQANAALEALQQQPRKPRVASATSGQ